ncbi:ATP-binding protein [Kitasatospora arboriphila]|uniref:Histidine kinase/HSP90-like ATPase domain-containing protein n=1 Tax=Kitasatospora arboriphila TaxID=258052 RepID=A0ABN1U328_9ACTN
MLLPRTTTEYGTAPTLSQLHGHQAVPLLTRGIPAGPAAARTARLEARGRFKEELLPEAADNLELVVTELVTNASEVTGEGATVQMRIRSADGALLVEVIDDCPVAPKPRSPSDDDEEGRGLLLVDSVCTSWGWHWSDEGKTVWAIVPTAPCA